ncbi:bifunctional helix-turn-helix transcriptional regulator/GNAT family N-acetyltransferase [Fictibacillus phosphorivorans]|uniref:bifunctional helix-turn-helix transcriptional regulator/GNAT family N-acetyltransferase n=1 Tax=Fictibacillus phosphorivorans TaxID=1221500 RepID=UPI00203AE035|nr:helix-turn-helix domain-containing GNAT family N-acetyltransferase [Fictibacillus phosphorivorans]MCM3718804.1 helix-turn-helix domain-containing GNAT family N-acetyltransferase [Fictibacillus phosphorivorans]MCM3776427.1 helix-turn-helix domain-containing GNAT family N-acetyltransferase [Fictibacillus phosphorivorans]
MKRVNYIEKIRRFNRYYANILGKIDQEIYNQPFPLTEARVITEIHSKKGSTATEVRENLGIDRGYMSRIIQRFEDENIIEKKQSTKDKRQYSLFLTEHGEKIYSDLVEKSNHGVEQMVQNLPESDLSKLVESMENIQSIYSEEKQPHPSELIIRPFRPGDAGYIAYLHGTLYDQSYKFGRIFEYYVMKGLAEFMKDPDGGELWVAEVNGEIAGSVAITKSTNAVAQLRWFILNEKYQGMGIGKKLLKTALDFCKEKKYKHVFLWTVSTLDAARYLYQTFNFKRTEEKPNEEWTGKPLVEERWDLNLEEACFNK